ncbi:MULTISPECIES: OsmC family protein [unclassified Halanaerobium]|uniref:OsmC family protein n=1 Tax=unclassified Halanaerobium TaxID=2641197 RepID=UPI000DF2085E|nr:MULTISPECIES: OsmC family protein [unclassified Halanaerobium]RCW50705.1 putative OsmC-like protein [Halanaerobium sp. MA284_MarDTE_T2]RCW86873.1 putative OsmC-like protein [Halanaerobium sp. DL-01]
MPLAKFSVTSKSENSTKVVAETRTGFKIIVDEPKNQGGTNDGPNPVEYVLAALSGCLNVVGHLVAKEMGIEMKGIEFEISGKLDPAKFMGQSEEKRAGYQEINATVKPDCDADEAALEKWIKAVEERCPVSDNLTNETPVNISL